MHLHALRTSKTFTIAVVCVAVFSDVLLQNLVVPVLPYALKERVGLTDEADVQRWNSILLAAFGGAFMLGSFLIGAISDRMPTHRTPFILGLLLAFTSTLCFALGTTLPVLLSARLLEGLSTAIVATVGYALMRETVGQERLGRATGFSSMALSMGLLLGPVLGGVLYEYAGYFETFLPALGLLGVELVLRLLVVEDRTKSVAGNGEDKGRREEAEDGAEITAEDEPGVVTAGIDPRSPHSLESQPLLPHPPPPATANIYLILLASPRFLTSLTGVFVLNSTACGFDAVLAPYISSTFSLGPLHVAVLFLTLALPMLCSPLTGVLTDRFGSKAVATTGLAIGSPSLAALSLIGPGTTSPMLKLGALFFLIGAAMALSLVPLQVDASGAVGAIEEARPGVFGTRGGYARAFGLVNGMVAAGGLVGPLVAGWVRITVGWEGMAVGMGGLTVMVLGMVVVWMGGREVRDGGEVC